MCKLEDIFTAKRAINDIKKICCHYKQCVDCPLIDTGVCDEGIPIEWETSPMFREKRITDDKKEKP